MPITLRHPVILHSMINNRYTLVYHLKLHRPRCCIILALLASVLEAHLRQGFQLEKLTHKAHGILLAVVT